ncbi:hypothetical protein BC008_33470 [Mastigocoleus testarum BC008]|uniref:Uncharacterized protein n=1 Tax=Mastigocoleus testarum BC008 TaxID=371196 RepID=A0A0V7ZV98_9CYAN|nr:hypothetical protein BC008_33470 [Mastigocoleus testarum BC008]
MFQLGIGSRCLEVESNQFGVESHPITPVIHPWLALFPFSCFIMMDRVDIKQNNAQTQESQSSSKKVPRYW